MVEVVTPGPQKELSLEQPTQQLNNIARALNQLYRLLRLGFWGVEKTVGHNAAGATGTMFTAAGSVLVTNIQASSTNAADAVTINWVDSSAGTTHNIITDGVIGAAYPLYIPWPYALDVGDTLTYSGADADIDFIVTYRESIS